MGLLSHVRSRLLGGLLSPAPLAADFNKALKKFDGSKYAGDWGQSLDKGLDLEKLRHRALQLWEQNSYGSGIIRRFATNVVNTGLMLESTPDAVVLNSYTDEELGDWSDRVEARFNLWSRTKDLVDPKGVSTFDGMQKRIYLEALISGDCLMVIHMTPFGPQIDIIPGGRIRSDETQVKSNNYVIDGVEFNQKGIVKAYHVSNGEHLEQTVRYLADAASYRCYLFKGTEQKEGQVRGVPVLTPILSLIRNVDTYRGAITRKMLLGSLVALFMRRQQGVTGAGRFSSNANLRKNKTLTDGKNSQENTIAEIMPGMIMSNLAPGEDVTTVQMKDADPDYPEFEAAIVNSMSWCLEVPVEIIRLTFSSNYSASQQAINEFNIFLRKERERIAQEVARPVYEAWLAWEVSTGKVSAPGINGDDYAIAQAWKESEWIGSIKPSMDPVKAVNAWKIKIEQGLATRSEAARALSGRKFKNIVKQLTRENELLSIAAGALVNQPVDEVIQVEQESENENETDNSSD